MEDDVLCLRPVSQSMATHTRVRIHAMDFACSVGPTVAYVNKVFCHCVLEIHRVPKTSCLIVNLGPAGLTGKAI